MQRGIAVRLPVIEIMPEHHLRRSGSRCDFFAHKTIPGRTDVSRFKKEMRQKTYGCLFFRSRDSGDGSVNSFDMRTELVFYSGQR